MCISAVSYTHLSIFPGQEALLSSDQIYVTSTHPRNGQKRIAMTGFPILTARLVIFLITGKAKAEVVEEICHSGDTGPAAYICLLYTSRCV